MMLIYQKIAGCARLPKSLFKNYARCCGEDAKG
jgi:hypothetical protein